ncbi:FAD-dependent oxidoreductase [Pleomorphovibrio marinus]|uniref:FAD-dependent oxidoreductase n=1 Tax=Pleomorphovibrio marinus TaxID=2164132 RepID=UPI000E0AD53E|nr:FAD-dependent oxidoreductase [Pleomorphovibrio marinus]
MGPITKILSEKNSDFNVLPLKNIRIARLIYCFLLLVFQFYSGSVFGQISTDVVVYGGTASGVTAAVAAAKEGMSVAIIEPGYNIGGMVTGGLSHTDYGDRTVIGGLAVEFYKKVAEYYDTHVFYWRGPEPHIGEKIFKDWLAENNVEVFYGKRVEIVEKSDGVISKMITTDGTEIYGKVFIDAGYEGDLMAKAKVGYTLGREGVKEYNESWAGRQPVTFTSHQITGRISPFNNDREKELLPLVHHRPMVSIGEGDQGIQSYCFRLIATDNPENMLAWAKPENYDPNTYELARRYYRANPNAGPLIGFWPTLPNGKSDINSSVGISTNLLDGSSWEYPEADYAKRDSIWQWHKDYTLGLAWFLATDPEVPDHVRESMEKFGLCKDEYVNNQNFPHQLYVRVARRMKGEYFMTQHDLMTDTVKYDAIGMGSYNIDVREMQRSYIEISRFPDMKYETYNEGYLSIPVAQYEIPYRSLVPKFEECTNLIVPVCVSGSALAIASIRMEPQYMLMGESAGVAAAMAVQSGRAVQHIDIYELRKKLKYNNQVLSLKDNPYGIWGSENEIIIDNNMKGFTFFTGDWHEEETVHTGRFEMNFRYNPKGQQGEFFYSPYFFKPGSYKVYIWYPSSMEYESKVPVTIHHANGESQLEVNQQENGGQWKELGTYKFEEGYQRALTIKGEMDQYVIADAVKFEFLQP